MKILWISFSFMTAEPWHASLASLPGNDIGICWYDRGEVDRTILDAADRFQPDIMLYTSMADWDKTPAISTFQKLRKIGSLVHISGDLSDPPYLPFLERYAKEECFDRTVNIDGNDEWPHGEGDLTLLSPTAPQFFPDPKPFYERPIVFGFAGGYASPSRRVIIDELVSTAGLRLKPYEHTWGSYSRYARFLLNCQAVVSIPFSGSDASHQVKGRVLESGLAKCCLLDHAKSRSQKWFTPGKDYLPYKNAADAAHIVKTLDPVTMQQVASNLHNRVMQEHSPAIFWSKVFNGLDRRNELPSLP